MPFRNRIPFLLALIVAACAMPAHDHSGPGSRQEEVARKGSVVMPFDLMKTTHFFDDDARGGTETVTANDPADAEQVALVRSHLAKEARLFARGDFSDPAAIHGHDMPGLAALSHAGGKLHVSYRELPAGASVVYASEDAAVIAAIHDWFAAQRSDHAAHMHMHMHMHGAPADEHGAGPESPIGAPAPAAHADRTVVVAMGDDMRFTPAVIPARKGETLRIVVENRGKLVHELVLGTREELDEHAAMMREHPGMQHDEPNAVRVAPGAKGEIAWRFTRAGEVPFACLEPGHFEAGMAGRVVVEP
jgi:uncharacterized cupredoxin-like copper-binding protein